MPCDCIFLLRILSEAHTGMTLIQAILSASPLSFKHTFGLCLMNKSGSHAHVESCPEIRYLNDTFCSEARGARQTTAKAILERVHTTLQTAPLLSYPIIGHGFCAPSSGNPGNNLVGDVIIPASQLVG